MANQVENRKRPSRILRGIALTLMSITVVPIQNLICSEFLQESLLSINIVAS